MREQSTKKIEIEVNKTEGKKRKSEAQKIL
jgi:hypothetical protein